MREERERFNEWRRERGYAEFPTISPNGFADYLRPMVLLSLNTGLRRGELFGLEWTDIDFEARTLAVRGAVAKSGNTRIVGLNDTALSVLDAWRRQHPGIGLVFKSPKTGKAFDNVNKAWRELLKDAKIIGFRWHDMRHSFASWLVQSGVDLYVVRQLMGHSSIAMTERYAHLAPQAAHEAVNRIRAMRGAVVVFPRSRAKKKQ